MPAFHSKDNGGDDGSRRSDGSTTANGHNTIEGPPPSANNPPNPTTHIGDSLSALSSLASIAASKTSPPTSFESSNYKVSISNITSNPPSSLQKSINSLSNNSSPSLPPLSFTGPTGLSGTTKQQNSNDSPYSPMTSTKSPSLQNKSDIKNESNQTQQPTSSQYMSPSYAPSSSPTFHSANTPSPTFSKSSPNDSPNLMKSNSSTPQNSNNKGTSKRPRKRKVDHACVYCRRSHMTCDESRPCQRCIRRNIGHLCHDEPGKKAAHTNKSKSVTPGGNVMIKEEVDQNLHSSIQAEPTPMSAHQSAALVLTAPQIPTSNLVFQELDTKSSNTGSPLLINNESSERNNMSSPMNLVSSPSANLTALNQQSQSRSNNKNSNNKNIDNHAANNNNSSLGNFNNSNNGSSTSLNKQSNILSHAQRAPLFNDWLGTQSILSHTSEFNQNLFISEHANSEFASLGDFLNMIEDPNSNTDLLISSGLTGSNGTNSNIMSPEMSRKSSSTDITKLSAALGMAPYTTNNNGLGLPPFPNANFQNTNDQLDNNGQLQFGAGGLYQGTSTGSSGNINSLANIGNKSHITGNNNNIDNNNNNGNTANINKQPVISDSARDKFFLTAADPSVDVSPEERLKQVIRAKVEAGLLQPFNYAHGYARLQKYMDNYMNQSSKQRILKPLSIFRPAFRAIAQSLLDVDLVLVEEAFERMLLDYDRIFTSMAIPACLWRRTGEIYRGNKEFAGLVEVNVDDLRDGKLAIYELMSEESAVNYWEKYGSIAFDSGQKAVLTSCNLRTRDGRKRRACCFSFTIQRDCYNIPSCIIGNFIPIHP